MVFRNYIKYWVSEGIAILFIFLFTYAAISKLIDFETFRLQLKQLPFFSSFASQLAWGILIIEIILALMFFFFKLRLVALYVSLLLITLFTVYITSVLLFADSIPCSCGGVISSLSWNEHLVFNVGWLLLALVGISLSTKTNNLINLKNKLYNSKNTIITK